MVYVLAMILRENKIEMPLAAKIANNIRYHLSSQKARYDCDFNFVYLSQCGMKGKTRKQQTVAYQGILPHRFKLYIKEENFATCCMYLLQKKKADTIKDYKF